LRSSTISPTVVVATTELAQDDIVADLAADSGALVFRGPETDVLSRFVQAAARFDVDVLARVSADSPFLDGASIDAVMTTYDGANPDLAHNHRLPGWPHGTAVEVLSRECLERIDRSTADPRLREHVTLYAYEHPDEFTFAWTPPPAGVRAPDLNLVLDTPDDLVAVRALSERVCSPDASLAEIVAVLSAGSRSR
jgi:spore coat polysaccharide biosynthesis protein SpsF